MRGSWETVVRGRTVFLVHPLNVPPRGSASSFARSAMTACHCLILEDDPLNLVGRRTDGDLLELALPRRLHTRSFASIQFLSHCLAHCPREFQTPRLLGGLLPSARALASDSWIIFARCPASSALIRFATWSRTSASFLAAAAAAPGIAAPAQSHRAVIPSACCCSWLERRATSRVTEPSGKICWSRARAPASPVRALSSNAWASVCSFSPVPTSARAALACSPAAAHRANHGR